jgi:hypothetical protein
MQSSTLKYKFGVSCGAGWNFYSLQRLPLKNCHSTNDMISSNVSQRANEQRRCCGHSIKELRITAIQLRHTQGACHATRTEERYVAGNKNYLQSLLIHYY